MENRHEKLSKQVLERREHYIASVMENTGWDRETTIEKIEAARERIGCNYYFYSRFQYYKMSEEEQARDYAMRQNRAEKRRARKEQRKEEVIAEIEAKTHWDQAYIRARLEETMKRTRCTVDEYLEFRFWELNDSLIDSFFLMCHTDVIRGKYNVDVDLKRLIIDKKASNKYFAKYIDRKWLFNKDVSFEQFNETFKGCSKIFYKPVNRSGGHGAMAFEINNENMKNVYDEIMSMPEGVVEEFVVQHPVLSSLSPNVLNTMRFATIYSDKPLDEEGNRFVIPYAMLKMGGVTGNVDNLKAGGVGAAIDLDTGKLCTDAVDINLNVYPCHPVTGKKIKGTQIPYFEEAKAMLRRITEENNMLGYLGWDIAITEKGPMLIEVNDRPSSILLELPYYGTARRGNKKIMEKYM